jgi:hypothetical protein
MGCYFLATCHPSALRAAEWLAISDFGHRCLFSRIVAHSGCSCSVHAGVVLARSGCSCPWRLHSSDAGVKVSYDLWCDVCNFFLSCQDVLFAISYDLWWHASYMLLLCVDKKQSISRVHVPIARFCGVKCKPERICVVATHAINEGTN